MTTLLTGGWGKTSSRVAQSLLSKGVPVVVTSRRGQNGIPSEFPQVKGVKFEWTDPSTFSNPFDLTLDLPIDRVYLVVAIDGILDVLSIAKPFIDLAISRGVKRIVFIGSSAVEKGGPLYGKIHEYLSKIGVEWAVMRPSWFLENFSTYGAASIRDAQVIRSATKNGKVGFVASDDISDAVVDALLVQPSYNTDHIVVGPELLSYSEVAAKFTHALGYTVNPLNMTPDELIAMFLDMGLTEEYANFMAQADVNISNGSEERVFTSPHKISGKVSLDDFIRTNKAVWAKASK